MKIIFAGTPDFAAVALQALLNTSHQIVAVYTQPDRKAGRGQKLTASPVKQLALQHDIPVYQPLHFKSSTAEGLAAQAELQQLDADVMVVAAYGLILPQAVLDMPRYGCLNIHASLLPRWRGAAPIQRAITAGDTQTGITIMQMAAGLDTGDMLYKTYCDIHPDDTVSTLHDKLALQGGMAICEVLSSLETLQHYQANKTPQDEQLTCYAEKITKPEAKIDWALSAEQIQRNIRAFYAWPVAFCALNDQQNLRIWSARIATPAEQHALFAQYPSACHGTILQIDKHGVWVQCGDDHPSNKQILCITSIQWAGGKPLNSIQILQTQKLQIGQQLQ